MDFYFVIIATAAIDLNRTVAASVRFNTIGISNSFIVASTT